MLDVIIWRLNLVQLFLRNTKSTHLRKMIVDLEVNVCCELVLPLMSVFLLSCDDILHGSGYVHPCRLLNLTMDVYSAKIQQYLMSGPKGIWMMISVGLFLRFSVQKAYVPICWPITSRSYSDQLYLGGTFLLIIHYPDTYSEGLRSNTRNAWNRQDFYNGACCKSLVDERDIHLADILYKLRCW